MKLLALVLLVYAGTIIAVNAQQMCTTQCTSDGTYCTTTCW